MQAETNYQDVITQTRIHEAYRQYFADPYGQVIRMPVYKDCKTQQAGIDVIFQSTQFGTYYIEEKIRDTVYPDVALEFRHTKEQPVDSPYYVTSINDGRGWVAKPLICHYIAYINPATVLMLEWRALQRAWIANGKQWIQEYPIASSDNHHYWSHSVCVPTDVLLVSLSQQIIISL